jgi:hypothetical protein
VRTSIIAVPLLSLLMGCGAGTPSATAASGTDCDAYRAGDACVTDENLAQCRALAARCPGQVLVMESCPLQFACP